MSESFKLNFLYFLLFSIGSKNKLVPQVHGREAQSLSLLPSPSSEHTQ